VTLVVLSAACTFFVALPARTSSQARTILIANQQVQAPNLPAPIPPGLPRITSGIKVVASYNWSGYAQSSKTNTFTGVTATFLVTTVKTEKAAIRYSADWVGIDGYSNNKLIQAGVEEDNAAGSPLYKAWTEVIPAAADPLKLFVSPGDTVTVTVRETATDRWTMTVKDVTTRKSATRSVSYATPGKSVEAVHERPCVEAPCISPSEIARLAQTSPETFYPAQFTRSPPGQKASYAPLLRPASGASLYDIVMTNSSGKAIATPSTPNGARDGFTVADGATAPSPPSS